MIEVGRTAREVALFCSDMHLGDHDPRTAALFLDRLDAQARTASHLFLLGDLFEAWVGDDQPDTVSQALLGRLAALAAAGTRVYAMRGNRDFLLDVAFPPEAATRPARSFGERSGATLIDDPCTVTLFGEPVLLAHGDALCVDDVDYQRARALARSDGWQRDFLARPLDERLRIARELRGESRRVQAARAMGDAANQPGGASGAMETGLGLGAGAGLGAAMAGMMSQAFQSHGSERSAPAAATIKCPNCGTENPVGSKFCNNCGQKMSGSIKCPTCGTENPPGSKFCSNDGTKLT